MHKNPPYSREEAVKQISRETHNPELIRAYTDIVKFNEDQNERNYIIDVYRALRDEYLGDQGRDFVNQDAWSRLLRKFDIDKDGSLNYDEITKMLHQCYQQIAKKKKETAFQDRESNPLFQLLKKPSEAEI